MNTATLVKKLKGYTGDAALYRLSIPLGGHEYVIVSAAVAPVSGPETYIFAAPTDGDIGNRAELPGSVRGVLSHEDALALAGYEVAK